MMRATTKKKTGARIAALVVVGFLVLLIASLLIALAADGEGAAMGIIGIYALVIGAVVVGIVIALRQRIREIDSGEEEDAKKY